MSKCAFPGCNDLAKSTCSACAREQYCSTICQKGDWKMHRSICPILKGFSNTIQPFDEVCQIINKILMSKKGNDIRILEHMLSYAEYQFGKQNSGKDYRERENGERISNWNVEYGALHNINSRIADNYGQNDSLSTIIRDEMRLPFLERSISLLNPWLTSFESKGVDDNHMDTLLQELIHLEQNLAALKTNSRHFHIAEGHCKKCLAYSRRFHKEGAQKTTMIFYALRTFGHLRELQGAYRDAVTFAEEGYNLVVVAYDPVHPQVQTAAGVLINILIKKGDQDRDSQDLLDAERYAQITYGNLRDKKNGMDQEGEEVANGSHNLAKVILLLKGDLIKAEELAREALRIRTLIYGNDHTVVGISCDLLANILKGQNKLGDETRGLYECCLATCIRNYGPEGSNTGIINTNIGRFYHERAEIQPTVDSKRIQLLLAKSHFEESRRIHLKIDGSRDPNTIDVTTRLATIVSELSLI